MNRELRHKGKKRMCIAILTVLLCIAFLVCIILPPSLGKTKPFIDDKGNTIDGSISEKIHVDINGTSLGMFIMAKDDSKPVLLFLGGGPGIPEYFLEQNYPTGLENEFVVCYMDYRGTALSYNPAISIETMTSEQYIADVIGVTNYLLNRFNQNKIYLIGHSFGTYIGIRAASQNPELYQAYIAIAQITNQNKSEKIAYNYMLEQYRSAENLKMVKKFEGYSILTSDKAYEQYFTSSLRDTAMHELGVGTMHHMNSVISGIFFPSLRCTVYTPAERINIWRGKALAQATSVVTDSAQFNAFKDVPALDIPIYFLAGIYDYTCNYSLQKEYCEQIQAPLKGFYTFENSAHSPLFEEPKKALSILLEDIVTGRNTLSD
ncbi:alpha/beta hydrolase [Desulfosporosinus youngiae]|uniref:Putative hydrolase or acyltransferase of alpha/beta superfamily n=1 Tax=Desulfosporosinus youngiae DSM 17734 TaxID=768710 RepID=H5Y3G7_9FIRM|nr:alpha/beta hydrolase [Desulfosporosinus youngiae]EHQ89076.1 putative hydrolase or acyltransferase of alpha/beta superfamily [Desulfosporosinus youngiae DSM 17734]